LYNEDKEIVQRIVCRWQKTYNVVGLPIAVRSNSPKFMAQFDEVFRRLGVPRQDKAQLVYSVIVDRRGRSSSRCNYILKGDRISFKTANYGELLSKLERDIEGSVMRKLFDHYLIHAGVVARYGKGLILPAGPGKGKTTLVAALLERGFQYLCDDFAIIDPVSLKVLPFPKSLCFEGDGLEFFPNLRAHATATDWTANGEVWPVWYVDPLEVGPGGLGEASSVKYIIFPEHDHFRETRLTRLSKAKAVLGLAENLLNFDFFGKAVVDPLINLVENSECFKLSVGKPGDGAALICELIKGG